MMQVTNETILAIVKMLSPDAKQILSNGWRLSKGRGNFSLATFTSARTEQDAHMEALTALGLLTPPPNGNTSQDKGMYFQNNYFFTRLGHEVARRCDYEETHFIAPTDIR